MWDAGLIQKNRSKGGAIQGASIYLSARGLGFLRISGILLQNFTLGNGHGGPKPRRAGDACDLPRDRNWELGPQRPAQDKIGHGALGKVLSS